ncbi:MAG: OB-fold nucleic acid binding domain-containing protein [Candidatus Auribacterota bacterium]|nr:OB-fold nucleic acid binding domain-containing protein [Candidatus Auribacterota bacterium]
MYISGHPLSAYENILKTFSSHTISQLSGLNDQAQVRIGGIIEQIDERTSRRTGKKFAFCQMEDLTGVVEVTAWNKVYQKFGELLQPGQIVFVEGRVTARDRGSNVQADKVYPIARAQELFSQALHINLHLASVAEENLLKLSRLFRDAHGRCPVFLDFDFATGEKVLMKSGSQFSVKCTPDLIRKIEDILGEKTAFIKT